MKPPFGTDALPFFEGCFNQLQTSRFFNKTSLVVPVKVRYLSTS